MNQNSRNAPESTELLLHVDNLQVGFDTESGLVRAVDGVSFQIHAGRTLGLVGESGCGKSVTASSILRLVPSPPGKILSGSIRFQGADILQMSPADLSRIRGKEISMIFQDPMTSLNPVFTVERQMGEVLELRFGLDRAGRARAVGRDFAHGGNRGSRGSAEIVSPRAFRRYEAKSHDRHGAALRTEAADR